jgi:outer membrane protein
MPEVKSASFKSEAAHLGFKIAQSELMPKLSLGASMNTAYNSANTLTGYQTTTTQGQIGYLQSNPSEAVIGNITRSTPYNYNYPFSNQLSDNFISGISLNLSVPIYNNRQFKSDVERADVNEKYALLNESLVKNQLRKTIETAYADMLAASKTYASAKSQLFSEERSYHDIELKFRFGAINTTDLFVEKNNLVKARLAFSQAKFQYMFKAKLVAFYLGEKITD